jgi:hypothetical protein
MDFEPVAERIIVRIEYADGQVREFEAEHPYKFEASITRDERFALTGDPLAIPAGEALSARISFQCGAYPDLVTVRHSQCQVR